MSKAHTDLDNARQEIDQVDEEILAQMGRLIGRRMEVARAVGALKESALKKNAKGQLLDPARERALLAAWSKRASKAGISPSLATRVLREILVHSRRSQERVLLGDSTRLDRPQRVAYHGKPETPSDLACAKLFDTRSPEGAQRIGYPTLEAAIEAVRTGQADYALVAVENSITGSRGEIERYLIEGDLAIVDEDIWESAPKGSAGRFLEVWDTSTAREPDITRFLLLSREHEKPAPGMDCKTSLLLTLDHQRGALARCLAAFAKYEVNLSRIESRPQPDAPWQYRFFVDVEGNASEEPLRLALEDVRGQCNLLRVLGTYPSRTREVRHLERVALLATAPVAIKPVIKKGVAKNGAKKKNGKHKVPAEAKDTPKKPNLIRVAGVEFGGERFVMIVGPCAVESRRQILDAAEMVKSRGASMLRGGAFKPRTSPHSFQGLGADGLDLLHEAGKLHELPTVTEVLRTEDVGLVAQSADMIQVGARNMQNFSLLRALGKIDRPVLLKRGLSATVKELLLAAEYITAGGNQRVILCERGIRTFETATRSTLDLGAVCVLKTRTHLPVIVDPSHAAGQRNLVVPLALAAAAAGADGLIVEAHPRPEEALCDKEQALHAEDLDRLGTALVPILAAQGRRL